MKTGLPIMGLQFCGWPTGVLTSNVPFSSPLPALGSGLGLSEVNGNSFLASSVPASTSESPALQTEKTASAPSTAVEVAKPVDYPNPKPIPEGKYNTAIRWNHVKDDFYSATTMLQIIFFIIGLLNWLDNFCNLIVCDHIENACKMFICLS